MLILYTTLSDVGKFGILYHSLITSMQPGIAIST